MPPTGVVWRLEEHTRGKHLVLRRYLEAWLPILGSSHGRILFIDGFAGPGEYIGGDLGSPLIALDTLLHHPAASRIGEVRFVFIEKDSDRAEHLRALIGSRYPSLPANCHVEIERAECEPTLIKAFDALDSEGGQLAPALLMLDPFGVAGVPMRLIERLFRYPRTEVYISVMWDFIRRFKEQPEFERSLDELFGTTEWRETMARESPDEARAATYELYKRQLRAAGAAHVLHFDLYQGGRLVYSIFFATRHSLGCDKMKQAIWKAAPDGRFEFRGQRGGQFVLDLSAPDYGRLRQDLLGFLADGQWRTIEEVDEFMRSDQTLFSTGGYKTRGPKQLENEGLIEVERPAGKRRGTFSTGTRVRRKGLTTS